MATSLKATFVRRVDVDSTNSELVLHQCFIGDVGCVVWDAALVLSKFIDYNFTRNTCKTESKECASLVSLALQKIQYLNKFNAVELGAGTGIVGLVASMLGCSTWLTDLESLQDLLQKNIDVNGLEKHATAAVLCWGEHEASFPAVAPDFLFVADCVYYPEAVAPLVKTISALSGPDTLVLVSYEDRQSPAKQALQRQFWDAVSAEFDTEHVPQKYMHPEFTADDIHIVVARRKCS